MRRLGVTVFAVLALAGSASAERPRLVIDRTHAVPSVELPPHALLPYNTIFVNRCPSGCVIRVGTPTEVWARPGHGYVASLLEVPRIQAERIAGLRRGLVP